MNFTKMQGCGNDFVLLGSFSGNDDALPTLARRMCDRRFGVGADGLILALPSQVAELRMLFFNPDGTQAEMCGNGIRCLARFARRERMVTKDCFRIETGAGIKEIEMRDNQVRVDMGAPILAPANIPVNLPGEKVLNHPIEVDGRKFGITCVSMGNPHCVIFVSALDDQLVQGIGPMIEKHPLFPKKTNTEFIQVLNTQELRMRVWERGAAETMACGTGACASAVAAVLNGKTGRNVTVHLLGGDLQIEWPESDNRIRMTGPAEFVFEGTWPE